MIPEDEAMPDRDSKMPSAKEPDPAADGGTAPDRAYTRRVVDTVRTEADGHDNRFDGLHAEAKAVLGRSANELRAVRDRYREAYHEELGRWQAARDVPDAISPDASARADDEATELGLHQSELSKLELAQRSLENMWLFLERGDASLIGEPVEATFPGDLQMRIVEAQEAERGRLAQEVHDGPAQALSNAIFQVEYIERVMDQDVRMARTELRFLRDLLRRELGDVRTFITQLRPPVLDQLGLDGAVADTAATMTALSGVPIETDLEAPADRLAEAEQTVVLRVVQEALQNVRKHAAATRVTVSSRMSGADWILEVRDDGRGFDAGAVAARGRRNFGLQFMRERAALIGARLEVRSRPSGGTVVMLAVPTGEERG